MKRYEKTVVDRYRVLKYRCGKFINKTNHDGIAHWFGKTVFRLMPKCIDDRLEEQTIFTWQLNCNCQNCISFETRFWKKKHQGLF